MMIHVSLRPLIETFMSSKMPPERPERRKRRDLNVSILHQLAASFIADCPALTRSRSIIVTIQQPLNGFPALLPRNSGELGSGGGGWFGGGIGSSSSRWWQQLEKKMM